MTVFQTLFPSRRHATVWLALTVALLGGVTARGATAAATLEYQVKAAYLLNFAKLVEWPPVSFPAPLSPFVLGIIGGEETAAAIRSLLAGKKVGVHPIEVRALTPPKLGPGIHILLVTRAGEVSLLEIQAALRGEPTLLVGETEFFAERAGMVGFAVEEDSVRLSLNLERTMAAGLKVSSKLSNVAKLVKTRRES